MQLYCEYAALEWFVNQDLEQPYEEPLSKEKVLNLDFNEFVFRNSTKLTVDIDSYTLTKKLDGSLNYTARKLFDSFEQDLIDIESDEEVFEKIENQNLNEEDLRNNWGIFFINKDQAFIDELELKTGLKILPANENFHINWEAISEKGLELKGLKSIYVSSNSNFQWQALEGIKLPFRTLCLVDRYIFSNETGLRENFLPLITSLLNGNPSSEVELMVIMEEISSRESIEGLEHKVREHLENNFPEKTFEIKLVRATRHNNTELHDRKIITDYLYFTSGSSFKFFQNNNIVVSTEVEISPLTKKTTFRNITNKLSELRTVLGQIENIPQETRVLGGKSLRLFELIE